MREIKFRAWGKRTKVMVDLHKITPLALDPNLQQDGVFIPFHEDIILMQYTGLKDKNGKEIYEGDVVRRGTSVGEVYWAAPYCGFVIDGAWGERQLDKAIRLTPQTEVVGNIYENPELLEATK